MKTITPTQLAALGSDAVIIDVRERHEFATSRIPGAVNLPMSELVDRIAELPAAPFSVICAAGGRSAQVTAYLAQAGHDATDVSGGMGGWAQAGLPVERGAA